MERWVATRISSAKRRGSSRPIVAETRAGERLVKLRGAGQGTGALVAEIIVAQLAEALGLFVPPRSLIDLPSGIEVVDWDDELADLLAASVGLNLGFDFLRDATDFGIADRQRVPAATQAMIFWLDRFVLNPDRTTENPNLLWWSDHLWLIDHGAALSFQYSWPEVSEDAPRAPRLPPDAHLFEETLSADDVAAADVAIARVMSRAVLEQATQAVDDDFLMPAPGAGSGIERRRAAFVAYLWKRLQPPRTFLELRPPMPPRPRAGPPPWLTKS